MPALQGLQRLKWAIVFWSAPVVVGWNGERCEVGEEFVDSSSLLQQFVGREEAHTLQLLKKLTSPGDESQSPCSCAVTHHNELPLLGGAERDPEARFFYELGTLEHISQIDDRRASGDPSLAQAQKCLYCDAVEMIDTSMNTSIGSISGMQLLVDDFLIESSNGLARFLNSASDEGEVHPCPEGTRSVTDVVHNGSHFLMLCDGSNDGGRMKVGISSSDDGENWHTQQTEGLDAFGLSRSSGDVARWCWFWDDGAETARYMVSLPCQPGKSQIGAMCIASSADGISWSDHGVIGTPFQLGDQACLTIGETSSSLDLLTTAAFASKHGQSAIKGILVADVAREAFRTGLSSGEVPFTIRKQWYLGRFGTLEQYRRQSLGLLQSMHGGVRFGLLQLHEWPWLKSGCDASKSTCNTEMKEFVARHFNRTDFVQPYLLTSRDGIHYNFQWVYNENPLHLGQSPSDNTVLSASSMITTRGHHHFFFTSSPDQRGVHQTLHDTFQLARVPQDRLSGLQPKPEMPGLSSMSGPHGEMLTRPFTLPQGARNIVFNAALPDGSSMFVDILPVDTPEASIEALGRWKGPIDAIDSLWVSLAGLQIQGALRLRIKLTRGARLYGFAPSESEEALSVL
mmetsp:Transcript_24769/g.54326  ORF Transcript_24769/g.54326 Transcript_24769/m.54326 type:complete len:626 (+) Transcript_24769:38-1915(+)